MWIIPGPSVYITRVLRSYPPTSTTTNPVAHIGCARRHAINMLKNRFIPKFHSTYYDYYI